MIVRPQPGPQTDFLSTEADIAFYGGAAGGGKSYALELEPLRHIDNRRFRGIIFRRTNTQVRQQGGLWDESLDLYSGFNAWPRETQLDWTFPSGCRLKFWNLEHEKTVLEHQGAQYSFIGFDEVTHFTERQFFYMLSRLRGMAGVAGYVRATCNPDPHSWVKRFIRWWLDEKGQYADPAKAGVLRWYIRQGDVILWADSKQELIDKYGEDEGKHAKSVTFIPSKLEDNQILMKGDPTYEATLKTLTAVDRARLQKGDWLVEESAGNVFMRENFEEVLAIPSLTRIVRCWDRAGSEVSHSYPDPDYTCSDKMAKCADGSFIILDLTHEREKSHVIERHILNVASQDTTAVTVKGFQDPGSAGKGEIESFVKMLAGYDVVTERVTVDKVVASKPFAAQCQAGNVKILATIPDDAKQMFYSQLVGFPDGLHDDHVDAGSGVFNELAGASKVKFF